MYRLNYDKLPKWMYWIRATISIYILGYVGLYLKIGQPIFMTAIKFFVIRNSYITTHSSLRS